MMKARLRLLHAYFVPNSLPIRRAEWKSQKMPGGAAERFLKFPERHLSGAKGDIHHVELRPVVRQHAPLPHIFHTALAAGASIRGAVQKVQRKGQPLVVRMFAPWAGVFPMEYSGSGTSSRRSSGIPRTIRSVREPSTTFRITLFPSPAMTWSAWFKSLLQQRVDTDAAHQSPGAALGMDTVSQRVGLGCG